MIRNILKFKIIIILSFANFIAHGQEFKDLTFRERLFFGGDFWLSLGNSTYINISPVIGYRLTDRFSTGLGPVFLYENYKYYKYETTTYGGKGFISYSLIPSLKDFIPINLGDLILYAENEVLSEELFIVSSTGYLEKTGKRETIDVFLAGGGIRQPIGPKASINFLILWDFTQHYQNPIIRFGFNF